MLAKAIRAAKIEKAKKVLTHIKAKGRPPKGYKGGKPFENDGRLGGQKLPEIDENGNPIKYQEWDIDPKQKGVGRGSDRIVTGSDGSAYFTDDHYSTFTQIE
jgi:guanyl-specific ribonuclease Sa